MSKGDAIANEFVDALSNLEELFDDDLEEFIDLYHKEKYLEVQEKVIYTHNIGIGISRLDFEVYNNNGQNNLEEDIQHILSDIS